jgi:acyl dehydratase
MKRLVATKVNIAAGLLVAAEAVRSRRPVHPGDRVRYRYYHNEDGNGDNTRLIQGTGTVELVRRGEPGIMVEGHPRWLFRKEIALLGRPK